MLKMLHKTFNKTKLVFAVSLWMLFSPANLDNWVCLCVLTCVHAYVFKRFLLCSEGVETVAIHNTDLSSFISCLYESKVFH